MKRYLFLILSLLLATSVFADVEQGTINLQGLIAGNPSSINIICQAKYGSYQTKTGAIQTDTLLSTPFTINAKFSSAVNGYQLVLSDLSNAGSVKPSQYQDVALQGCVVYNVQNQAVLTMNINDISTFYMSKSLTIWAAFIKSAQPTVNYSIAMVPSGTSTTDEYNGDTVYQNYLIANNDGQINITYPETLTDKPDYMMCMNPQWPVMKRFNNINPINDTLTFSMLNLYNNTVTNSGDHTTPISLNCILYDRDGSDIGHFSLQQLAIACLNKNNNTTNWCGNIAADPKAAGEIQTVNASGVCDANKNCNQWQMNLNNNKKKNINHELSF